MHKAIVIVAMVGYAYPFVYRAMYRDYSSWSMAGYFFMLVITPILAVICSKAWSIKAVLFGNVLTFFVSYYFVQRMEGVAHWGGYFSPLTPVQLLVFVSVCIVLLQLLVVKISKKNDQNL